MSVYEASESKKREKGLEKAGVTARWYRSDPVKNDIKGVCHVGVVGGVTMSGWVIRRGDRVQVDGV